MTLMKNFLMLHIWTFISKKREENSSKDCYVMRIENGKETEEIEGKTDETINR